MNGAMDAMSDVMSDERVRNQKERRPRQHLRRNSGPSALDRLSARFEQAM